MKHYFQLAGRALTAAILLFPAMAVVIGCRATLPMDLTAAGRISPVAAALASLVAGGFAAWTTRNAPFRRLVSALAVALLAAPFALVSHFTLWSVAAAVAGIGWAAYRLALAAPGSAAALARWERRITPRAGARIAAGMALLTAFAAFLVYREAVLRQYLFWQDWGIFNETAWNTLHGRFMACDIHGGENFFGDHFMPGFYLLFVPLLAIFPSPLLLPLLADLALYGSAFLVYRLGRTLRLRPGTALVAAAAYLLYPVTANLNLSGLYGSHVITFLIPLMLAFAIAYYGGRRKTAFLLFLASLTIKESAAVLWAGWAVVELLFGRRRFALAVLAFAVGWFAAVTGWIIPAIAGSYRYTGHYQALGNGIGGVLLAPLLRPGAFWGTLLTPHNGLLAALLLLPLFPVLLRVPRFLPAALLPVAVNMLRGNPAVVNLAMHHNTECLALLAVLAALGLARTGRVPGDRLLALGLPDRAGRRRAARTAALLTTALLCHWFCAQSFIGCASVTRLLGLFPRKTELTSAMLAEVPPGAVVAADHRSAAMFMLRNRIAPLDRAEKVDYVCYNRRASDVGGALHRGMLNDPAFGPILRRSDGGGSYWLFRRGARHKPAAPGPILDDAAWAAAPGVLIDAGDPAFEVKMSEVEQDGRHFLRFLARKVGDAGDDGEFQLTLRGGGHTRYFSIFYGNGLRAAGDAAPGELFVFGAEIPADWPGLDEPPLLLYKKI